ncbi:hypothetical protein NL676_038490 [Syzygium grande]|nr:hypothetical protein NL676_038490 [Syzygium grande]
MFLDHVLFQKVVYPTLRYAATGARIISEKGVGSILSVTVNLKQCISNDKKEAVSPSTAESDMTKSLEDVGPKDDRLSDPSASTLVTLDGFGKIPALRPTMEWMSTSSKLVVQQDFGTSDALRSYFVVPIPNVEDSFVFGELNGEMDTGMHDDLISNILTWPLAASVKVGSKFQPKPKHQSRNNVSTSITSSQPPVVEELPVELPSTSLGNTDIVSGWDSLDDLNNKSGKMTDHKANESRDQIDADAHRGNKFLSADISEVRPGDQPRDLVLSETQHLDEGSAPASIPDDIFDYSSIELDDGTSRGPAFHESSHSDLNIQLPDLSHHYRETLAASGIPLMQDKSCVSNTMSEGNTSTRQLRKHPAPCQLVHESDGEVHSDGNNSAEAHTQSHSGGDESYDGDEYKTQNSSQKKSSPTKSK